MSVVMKKDLEEVKDDDIFFDFREECLVMVFDVIVYFVDDQQSFYLVIVYFLVVCIIQKGNGIVVLVCVGEDLYWFLMKDMFIVKFDFIYYFFMFFVLFFIDVFEDESKFEV